MRTSVCPKVAIKCYWRMEPSEIEMLERVLGVYRKTSKNYYRFYRLTEVTTVRG
ncbi:MAG: hypothetical protein LUQ38_10485 [Methanotrichaceae archaeon]|nr:hypothetical protein [Methanotrichaceae archaeon]